MFAFILLNLNYNKTKQNIRFRGNFRKYDSTLILVYPVLTINIKLTVKLS